MNSRSLDKFETFQSYEWVKKGNRTLEIGDTCSVWVNGKEATLTVAALGLMSEGKDRVLPMVAYTVSLVDGPETMQLVSFNKIWHEINNFKKVCRSCVNIIFACPTTHPSIRAKAASPPNSRASWATCRRVGGAASKPSFGLPCNLR